MNRLFKLLLFTAALLLVCCNNSDDDSASGGPNDPSNPAPMDTLTYLALGDSYTIGEAVAESERWPVLLANQLTSDGIPVAEPVIVAQTGWTTAELQQGIAANEAIGATPYDLVSLLIGVNNQYRGQSLETYKVEFTELLDYAISKSALGAPRVFVVSIPDYGYTPFGENNPGISPEIDQFNAAAAAICAERNIPFLNITPISREGLETPALVASDNLHPSGEQYQRWVEEVILMAVKVLLQ